MGAGLAKQEVGDQVSRAGSLINVLMHDKSTNRYRRNVALGLVAVSFAVCVLIIVATAGIWNTPYETADSTGRRMGFNDPLSPEHYRIAFSNFRFSTLLAPAYA